MIAFYTGKKTSYSGSVIKVLSTSESIGLKTNEKQVIIFVEPACSERDIVGIMIVRALVRVSTSPCKFVRNVTSTIMDGFQNNLMQLFSITCRCAI